MGNQYLHKKVKHADGVFDSKKEYETYLKLKNMENSGLIQEVKRQVKFTLIPNQYFEGKLKERAVSYIADFTFMEDGKLVVVDVKSAITKKQPEYIIKRKLMLHVHGICLREI